MAIPTAGDATTRRKPAALTRAFFNRSVHSVAPDLIGTMLLFNGVGGVIAEVEAYHQADPASHSYGGPTARNAVMFGPAGHVYIYRSYGIHWCVNFVCEAKGSAAAVLIRALIPTEGIDKMRRRRGVTDLHDLCSGPGKLCQALGITGEHNGLAVNSGPLRLLASNGDSRTVDIAVGVRIGISKAVEQPWRYGLRGSRFLSKPIKPL